MESEVLISRSDIKIKSYLLRTRVRKKCEYVACTVELEDQNSEHLKDLILKHNFSVRTRLDLDCLELLAMPNQKNSFWNRIV